MAVALRILPIAEYQWLLRHLALCFGKAFRDQMMLRAFIADRIGVGRIARQHKSLAAAAAQVPGFLRAAAAGFAHPSVSAKGIKTR